MSRYSLEVVAPHGPGVSSESENRLTFALESLAMIHGGKVVEPPDASTTAAYRRQFVNIYDCESSLEKEVEWLRKEFPGATFTLNELTQQGPGDRSPQRNTTTGERR